MKALRVLRMVRQKERDNDEVKFSDYDITEALNEAIRYLNIDLSNKRSQYLERYKDYVLEDVNSEIIAKFTVYGQDQEVFSDTRYVFDVMDSDADHVDFATTGVDLPDGLVTIAYIERIDDHYRLRPATTLFEAQGDYGMDKYFIFGGKIYTKSTAFRISYYGTVPEIADISTESIELPDILIDLIAKMTRLVLNNGDNDALTQAMSAAVDAAIPRRRYSNARQKMPFYL